jgi:hypothetical protein
LVLRPNAGVNGPMKPAAVQAARALAIVNPTRLGTISQAGVGVGVGDGVGAGVGVGVGGGVGVDGGVGDGAGVGLGNAVGVGVGAGGGAGVGVDVGTGAPVGFATGVTVGPDVVVGVALGRGVGVAPGTVGAGLAAGALSPTVGVPFGAANDGAVSDSPAPPVTGESDDCPGLPAMRACSVDVDGVPTALSTPPAGLNDDPTASVTTMTATAAALTPRSLRGSRCRWSPVPLGGRAIGPGAGVAWLAPHPGHTPAAVAQHRSHAKTQQVGHIRSRIRRSVEAAPIRFPQRSQYGSGGPPDGGDAFGTRMIVRAVGVVGPFAPGGREPCATDRAAVGSWSRRDNTGVGQAPGAAGATEPGGAPPMDRIGQ